MATRIHVFAIAVEMYQKATIKKVDYAENDANGFVKAWQTIGANPSDCVTLLSANATKTATESSFKKFLNGVAKGDLVVFFFAGHGVAYNDVSYFTTHDTQPGDIKSTSISLASVLKQLRECNSERVLLFIDACESGLPISEGMRSITSSFSSEGMSIFCQDAEHHAGFAACMVDESSWSSAKFQHGIWSYAVMQALSGDAKDALDKGTLVTSDSLRDYLSAEVPRLLRSTHTGNETQTPCWFGNATKQFIVADLTQIFADRAAKTSTLGSILKASSLRGEKFGSVRSLSGFKKGHHVPDRHSNATESFVRGVGHEEVKAQAEAIHERIRANFSYKRKDINYECDDGVAIIKTPDFDVNLLLVQNSDDAAGYVLTTEVGFIRRMEVVTEDGFSNVFSSYCDTVVIDFARRLDIEAKIDDVESIPEFKKHFKYEADCSSFTLDIPSHQIRIHVTADKMTISLVRSGNIKTLLRKAQSALATLGNSGVILTLPEKGSP